MRLFIEQCFPAISHSTPHLYLSLTWIHVESQLWKNWNAITIIAQILKEPLQRSSQLLLSIDCPPKVDTFAVSPDGRCIAGGSRDGYVRVWDLVSGALIRWTQSTDTAELSNRSEDEPSPVDALAYTWDGSKLFCVLGGYITALDPATFSRTGQSARLPCDNVQCISTSSEPTGA